MNRIDLLLTLAFAVLGAILGVLIISDRSLFFYQNFTPEIVYFACGHGMHHPGTTPPQLLTFLLRESQKFDCADLGAVGNLQPPGFFMLLQLYFSWLVAWIWRVSSISYFSLWPLVALLTGLYTSGCYMLLRQFVSRFSAIVGGGLLAFSPIALPLLILLRDYGKAPFFIWALVFLVQALKVRDLKGMLVRVAASGLMVGIGCGFRLDLIILLPLGIITLLFAFERQLFLMRLVASVVYFAAIFTSAYPILSVANSGTHGSIIIQGMSDPFRTYLKLEPTLYSFGPRYSDELVLSSVAADESKLRPDWNDKEGKPYYDVSQATTLSGKNWERFLPLFLADFVAQAFKSAGWIVGLPVLTAVDRLPDPSYPVLAGPPVSLKLAPVYQFLAQHWLPWLCMAGLALFLWRLWSQSKSQALGIAFLLGALLTYTVVQFSVRHVFHLEFIWVLAVLTILEVPLYARNLRNGGASFGVTLVGSIGLGLLIYYALTLYQQSQLISEFGKLLADKREAVAEAEGSSIGTPVQMPLPVPAAYAPLLASPPDSMTPEIAGKGIQWDVRSAADRILFTFSGSGCTDGIAVATFYSRSEKAWQQMNQTIRFVAGQPADGTQIIVPAFYRPTQHLSYFEITGMSSQCHVMMERLVGSTRFPALMSAVLPPNWKNLPLRLGFGKF